MVIHTHPGRGTSWQENVIQRHFEPRTEEEEIAEWLGSNDLYSLLAAMEALDRREDSSSELLRFLARHDAQEYRRAKLRFRLMLLISTVVALLVLRYSDLHTGAAANAAMYLLIPAWLTAPFFIAWADSCKTHRRRLRNTVTLLHRKPSLSALAELIEAMESGDSETATFATKSLIRLLPQVTEADGSRLCAAHHVMLQHALHGNNALLILAILRAYETIGDHTDILAVRRLTECPAWIAESRHIQQAAYKTLSLLETACERRHLARTSLRAASASTKACDCLLQPASCPKPARSPLTRQTDNGLRVEAASAGQAGTCPADRIQQSR